MINYTLDEQAFIFMSQFEFMTSKKFEDVFSCLDEARDLFSLTTQQQTQLKQVLGKNYDRVLEALKNFDAEKLYQNLDKRGIKCTTIASEDYPYVFFKLKEPPYVIYYIGDLKLVNCKNLAVVGSRNPSPYGKIITEKFVKKLAENGICIVSGLATGIDKIAHESSLAVNGKTIAVLGGGFDHIFPALNINLAREIAKKGLLITEYGLDIKAAKYTFPYRNRIIAALSQAILIPEAKKGSGSLYTQSYGDELGIDTFCIPGNITSELSYATNDLIKRNCVEAATCPEDILQKFGIKPTKQKQTVQKLEQYTMEESLIVNLLKDGEKDFEFLQEKTQFSTQMLNISLTSLEIRGIIKKLAGNGYILC
ncbi:MAG: DNA-protecting protein DprA [Clostridiales bacterium]|nr:DNA-protecting protein DprA [Clostridiales bacterium]